MLYSISDCSISYRVLFYIGYQFEFDRLCLGMLENFSKMIEKYGMIPNGNRVYYTRRSQPPLFIAMVDEYYQVKEQTRFAKHCQ